MAKEPSYEELLMQNSLLKKQNKYLSEHTERVEKQNVKLSEENKQLNAELKQLTIDYNWILEQLKLSKRRKFGASAEAVAEGYEQINLFNEAEAERTAFKPEPTAEEVVKKSKNKKKSIQKS